MTDLIPTRVHNLIIVDESGSMECIRKQAFTGMNETLQTVRMMQKKYPHQLQYVTLITFDSDHTKLHYDNTLADKTTDLKWKAYNPCAATPLYDAIGKGVSKVNAQVEEGDHVLVTIITDGYENASRTWSGHQIKSLVQELRQMGWTFTYIGADQDVEKVAGEIGVQNSLRFSANAEETQAMFEKERRSRSKFYSKVCCEMASPCASMVESNDYFADDEEPVVRPQEPEPKKNGLLDKLFGKK